MANLDQLFLQKMTVNGTEIPPELLVTFAYIETSDLSGPQMHCVLRDMTGTLVDNIGLREGSLCVCSLGDPDGIGGVLFQETFCVVKAPAMHDQVEIMAFSKGVLEMKRPAQKSRFFKDRGAATIISALAPGIKLDADCFKRQGTWHLNNGQTPSELFREITRDHAAMMFNCRGKMQAKSLANIAKGKGAFRYEVNNPKAEYRFSRFANVSSDYEYAAKHNASPVGYSMTDGYRVAQGSQAPVDLHPVSLQGALNNQHKYLQPLFDAECLGNGALTPGMVLDIVVHRYSDENPIDESLPPQMIIDRVTHYQDRFSYMCRVILGVVK
ncbi:hypothetical protein L6019_RS23505 [Escherichia coli]|nr:hypothetical protein [Escherichia coli]EKG7113520.1 hypothetical protein [Escherichia coli]ELM8776557.1 hypothetical protein [Escherichia coli]EMA4402872.1 hypothetical protein [Escherichia coli]HAH8500916.1 hypothetical protein [Escherichia coli]